MYFSIQGGSIAALSLLLCSSAFSETWHKIAEDDFGNPKKQPHLLKSEGNYRMKFSSLSASLNSVAYGKSIDFTFSDINPVAKYRIKLHFLCDSGERKQSILVNSTVLQKNYQLKKGKALELTLDIPQSIANTGTFKVSVKSESPPNAVISYAELLSTENQKLKIPISKINDFSLADLHVPIPKLSSIPVSVQGVKPLKISLDGTWKFLPKAPDNAKTIDTSSWYDIKVPGEWAMQGFDVPMTQATAYHRNFKVPATWKDQRVKLRFDSVYSDCHVYVNGQAAGHHVGTYTPFELDVTSLVHFGKDNDIRIHITCDSVADRVASGSKYACHPLGGIPRSITAFALPQTNLRNLFVHTTFDKQYKNATLHLSATVVNDSDTAFSGGSFQTELALWQSSGITPAKKLITDPSSTTVKIPQIAPGKSTPIELHIPVANPLQWNCETPHLYVAQCQILQNSTPLLTLNQRFGFREIKVDGHRMLVNGKPIKIRGVNRHEVHPRTGRSLDQSLYRKDVELFLAGNVNHLRTSHYPPDETLMEVCDELGMFIECEAPHCWSHQAKDDLAEKSEQIIRNNLEMVNAFRNHPSIIFWSLANESHWDQIYARAGNRVKQHDPSRPTSFGHWHTTADKDVTDISSAHYKGFGGIKKFATHFRPVNYGEYAHLNAYNRRELATDPSLRSQWGIYLHQIWEKMYATPTLLGGSTWAGIDDTFYWDFKKPDGSIEERTVGYGTWGPIDGWRRKKPEWWGMKKAYSPIWISPKTTLTPQNGNLLLPVQNRQYFSNLNRYKITWKIGNRQGETTADISPGNKGNLSIPYPQSTDEIKPDEFLELRVQDPRQFEVNHYKFPIVTKTTTDTPNRAIQASRYTVKEIKGQLLIQSDNQSYHINTTNGQIEKISTGSRDMNINGPHLMILSLNGEGSVQMHGPTKQYTPHTATCSDWKATSVTHQTANHLPVVTVKGSYKEAKGQFTYTFKKEGTLDVSFDFQSTGKVNPRQIGIVFNLPTAFDTLNWKRKGFWTTYPDWHIARLSGQAKASDGFPATLVGPRNEPSHEWNKDMKPGGSNDFCSTKHHILTASLQTASGQAIQTSADADRHVRAWLTKDHAHFLIANFSNGGSERYLRGLAKIDDRPIKAENPVRGNAIISFK